MKRYTFAIIALLFVAGCQTVEASPTPITTTQPTATASLTPEPTATITPTPTPTLPPLDTSNKGYPLITLEGPEGALYRLGMGWRDEAVISPDSHLIALPATTGLYVYTTDSLEPVWIANEKPFVTKAVWSPDGSRVIALYDDESVSIFAADDGSLLHQFPVNTYSYFPKLRNKVEISPNNQLLFAGQRLYDVASGEELACAYCPDTYIYGYDAHLTFTADSTLRVAHPCDEALFCLWDGDSGESIPYPLPGVQEGGPFSISPDGNWVLVETDNTFRLFDVQEEAYLLLPELTDLDFSSLPNKPDHIIWAPDSSAFAVQALQGDPLVYHPYLFRTGEETSALDWAEEAFVIWSPDSSLILCRYEESVELYDAARMERILVADGTNAKALLDDGRILWEYYAHPDYYGLAVSNGNEADFDYSVILDTRGHNLVSAVWTPDNLLMIAVDEPDFFFFDGATGSPVSMIDSGVTPIFSSTQRDFQWSADGRRLFWRLNDRYIRAAVWDRATGEFVNTYSIQDYLDDGFLTFNLNAAAFNSDGRRLLLGSHEQSTIALLDVETGEMLSVANEDDHHGNNVIDLAWSPDGSRFASVDDGTIDPIIVWDAESFSPLYTLVPKWEDRSYIKTINWVDDLIAGYGYGMDGDERVFVWQASTQGLLWSAILTPTDAGCQLNLAERNSDIDNQMALSADGRYLAVVTGGAAHGCGRIAVYDAHTGELLHTYPGNGTTTISRLAWSPDGQYLASVAREDTIVVWDTSLLPPVEIP